MIATASCRLPGSNVSPTIERSPTTRTPRIGPRLSKESWCLQHRGCQEVRLRCFSAGHLMFGLPGLELKICSSNDLRWTHLKLRHRSPAEYGLLFPDAHSSHNKNRKTDLTIAWTRLVIAIATQRHTDELCGLALWPSDIQRPSPRGLCRGKYGSRSSQKILNSAVSWWRYS